MEDVSYLTQEGAERLKKELESLKGPARQQIASRLRAAIQQGDLSENADYHSAKEDQAFLEGKIMELEALLRNVVIIEKKQPSDVIEIGAHITVQEEGEEQEVYYLVGPKEADPKRGMISFESPIGAALRGRKAGDLVEITTPGGKITYKVLKVD